MSSNLQKTTSAFQKLFTKTSLSEKAEKTVDHHESGKDSTTNALSVHQQQLQKSNARHCEMIKIYFLDHYLDFLTYLDDRKKRTEQCQADINNLESTSDKQTLWKQHCGKERSILRKRRTRIRPCHFQTIKQIGQGGYGQVFLARKIDSREICALKKMSKKLLFKLGETQHILTERDILTRTDSPWLVKLLYAFQDYENVYLVMEYVPGGDFRTLLNASGILHDHHAKFYFAEMCAAVFSLHKLGYLHRDLKPENFLLDASGHIKLTDFGLSRGKLSRNIVEKLRIKLDEIKLQALDRQTFNQRFNTYQTMRRETRAFSIVGSPDYMAIEILTQESAGYDYSVDYWSLGCILFEAVCGYPPFTAPTTDKVWINLYNWKKVLERPLYEGDDVEFNLTDDCWDMITRLICDQKTRLRYPQDVQAHKYFRNVDLDNLRSPGYYDVPLTPKLQTETDTTYFDDFSDPKDMALYAEIKRKESANRKKAEKDIVVPHSAFVGFTFKHN